MGKSERLKRLRKQQDIGIEKRFADLMTKNFQKELRNSEIWDQMVDQFGEEKSKKMLKNCKAKVKPGDQF